MGRLRPADLLAGIGGAVLLGSLFLHWYGLDAGALVPFEHDNEAASFVGSQIPDITAWQAFSITDILLAAVAALALALPLVTAVARGPAKPVAFGVIASAVGPFAILLVLYRIVNQPGSNEAVAVRSGAWIGLAGAVLLTVGAWLALADERTPGAAVPQVPRRPAPRPE